MLLQASGYPKDSSVQRIIIHTMALRHDRQNGKSPQTIAANGLSMQAILPKSSRKTVNLLVGNKRID